MDEKLNQPGVFQRISDMIFMRKQIVFVDSEGSEIEKTITEVFASIQVTGVDAQGVTFERKFRPGQQGESRGWESIDRALLQRERRAHRARN